MHRGIKSATMAGRKLLKYANNSKGNAACGLLGRLVRRAVGTQRSITCCAAGDQSSSGGGSLHSSDAQKVYRVCFGFLEGFFRVLKSSFRVYRAHGSSTVQLSLGFRELGKLQEYLTAKHGIE